MKTCIAAFFVLCVGLSASPAVGSPMGPDFSEVAERVLPTTVYIQVARSETVSPGMQQMVRDFALPTPSASGGQRQHTTGSGVIVDEEGFLLTNHHVVNGAKAIMVTLSDQRTYPAVIVGSDPRTDLAVLGIQGEGPFKAAAMGNSDTLAVGQWVIAVGHPFDFPFTVTAGIVSARGRRQLAHSEIQDYIQTDVAVNPGSSGGPLFDTQGRLVGINTAIYSPDKESSGSAGISFAIPSNLAIRVSQSLVSTGRVEFGAIGVVTADAPATPRTPRPGAEVVQVRAGGPADAAGIRRGDVIIEVNQEPIPDGRSLRALVLAQNVGSEMMIRLRRGDRFKEVRLHTAAESRLGATDTALEPDALQWAGLSLVEVNPDRLAARGIALPPEIAGGLLVLNVVEDSPGATAGIMEGDVIVEVFKRSITTTEMLQKAAQGRRTAVLSLYRDGATHLSVLAIEQNPD